MKYINAVKINLFMVFKEIWYATFCMLLQDAKMQRIEVLVYKFLIGTLCIKVRNGFIPSHNKSHHCNQTIVDTRKRDVCLEYAPWLAHISYSQTERSNTDFTILTFVLELFGECWSQKVVMSEGQGIKEEIFNLKSVKPCREWQ